MWLCDIWIGKKLVLLLLLCFHDICIFLKEKKTCLCKWCVSITLKKTPISNNHRDVFTFTTSITLGESRSLPLPLGKNIFDGSLLRIDKVSTGSWPTRATLSADWTTHRVDALLLLLLLVRRCDRTSLRRVSMLCDAGRFRLGRT